MTLDKNHNIQKYNTHFIAFFAACLADEEIRLEEDSVEETRRRAEEESLRKQLEAQKKEEEKRRRELKM